MRTKSKDLLLKHAHRMRSYHWWPPPYAWKSRNTWIIFWSLVWAQLVSCFHSCGTCSWILLRDQWKNCTHQESTWEQCGYKLMEFTSLSTYTKRKVKSAVVDDLQIWRVLESWCCVSPQILLQPDDLYCRQPNRPHSLKHFNNCVLLTRWVGLSTLNEST